MGFFLFLGLLVVSIALNELLAPKPNFEDAVPSGLGDFNFPTATEGRVVPLVFGRVALNAPNVVWYGAFDAVPVTKKVRTTLFQSERVTTGYQYYVGMQGALCQGEVESIHKIWIGDDLVYSGSAPGGEIDIDEPEYFGGSDGNGGFQGTFDFYLGSPTQTADDFLAIYQDAGAGTNRTPAYRNICYFVLRALTSTAAASAGVGAYVGNSTGIKPLKFEVSRYSAAMAGQPAGEHKIGDDCNPINVLYELLTDTRWGFGINSGDVDLSSMLAAAHTCYTEGIGFSTVLATASDAATVLISIEKHIDGVVFLDKLTGLWRVKLARADYVLADTPHLTVDNVIEVKEFSQGSWSDTVNRVDIKFSHRASDYTTSYATSNDSANFITQGGGTISTGNRITAELSYSTVMTASAAAIIAFRELRTRSYPLARGQFVINREMWDVNMGDVVRWTDSRYGYDQLAMRITKVDYGDLISNKITISCVQDVFQYGDAAFGAPPATSWAANYGSPIAYPADEQLIIEAPRKLVLLSGVSLTGDPNIERSRLLRAFRKQSGDTGHENWMRSGPSTPISIPYVNDSVGVEYCAIGTLAKDINVLGDPGDQTNSDATLTINVTEGPSSFSQIQYCFNPSSVSEEAQGTELLNLIMIGNEFLTCDYVDVVGSTLYIHGPKRGVLDSSQEYHTAGADVFFLGLGLEISTESGTGTSYWQAYARMQNYRGETYGLSPTVASGQFSRRMVKPYPAAGVLYNSSTKAYVTSPSIDGLGTSENDRRMDVDFRARLFLNSDEVVALTTDDSSVSTYSTQYQLVVRADPDGANDLVYQSSWSANGTTFPVLRTEFFDVAEAGTLCEATLTSRHTYTTGGSTYTNVECLYPLVHRFTPTSATYSGKYYMGGGLAINEATPNVYEVASTATHRLVAATAVTSGALQYRVNAGAWADLITSGTTGDVALTAGNEIEFRRTADFGPVLCHLLDNTKFGQIVAYFTCKN